MFGGGEKREDAFKREIESYIDKKSEPIDEVLFRNQINCYTLANKNIDKFSECMSNHTKNFEKQLDSLKFRSVFLIAQALECFEESKGDETKIQACKTGIQKRIDDSYSAFYKSV